MPGRDSSEWPTPSALTTVDRITHHVQRLASTQRYSPKSLANHTIAPPLAPGKHRAIIAHRLFRLAEHRHAFATAIIGQTFENDPVGEYRLYVIARLTERNRFNEQIELLRRLLQPAIDPAGSGIVSGSGGKAVAAVALGHVADIGAAQADIEFGVEYPVRAGIADAELAAKQGRGARHDLHQPTCPRWRQGHRVVSALATGNTHQ